MSPSLATTSKLAMNRTSSGAAMHDPGQPRCVRSGVQPDAVEWRRAILGPTLSVVEARMENWFIMSPSPTTTSRRVAHRTSSSCVSVGRTARQQAAVFGQRLSAVAARMEGWVFMSPSLATTSKPSMNRTSSGAAMYAPQQAGCVRAAAVRNGGAYRTERAATPGQPLSSPSGASKSGNVWVRRALDPARRLSVLWAQERQGRPNRQGRRGQRGGQGKQGDQHKQTWPNTRAGRQADKRASRPDRPDRPDQSYQSNSAGQAGQPR